MNEQHKQPTLLDALIPIGSLILMLGTSVYLFGADSSFGANQIALILCACIAGLVGMKNGLEWADVEEAMLNGISLAFGAILILLAVGSLIGAWILSGTVPSMIFYGLQAINPDIFYATCCAICAVVALTIGSSWTVAGTLGISLIGIAAAMNMSLEITAGAIVSGAYFGDKLSPLSETTNLASAITGSNLFAHIKNMLWTTIPAIAIALAVFFYLGMGGSANSDAAEIEKLVTDLNSSFNVSVINLLPLLVLLGLAWRKMAALPTILIGALTACALAVFTQPEAVASLGGDAGVLTPIKAIWISLFDGYTSNSGNEVLDELLSKGGMSSMLNTIWLVISAMAFGGVLERAGLLQVLVTRALSLAKSVGGLIATTVLTCIGTNVISADQYISVVLPGRMFRLEFEKRGPSPLALSRTIEDSGTITSALIPWNTCGAYMAGTLGVATMAYAPYAVFNWVCPLIAIAYGYFNIKLLRIEGEQVAA